MEPLIVLVGVSLALYAVGRAGVRRLRPWPVALRGGVAAMFAVTGIAHFVGMREELVAMVPPGLPAPELLVTLTGVLELAGAAGVLLRRTSRLAAGCLAVLLIVMFPANVYACLAGVPGHTPTALWPRTLLQIAFLGAVLVVAVVGPRSTHSTKSRSGTTSAAPTPFA